MKQRKGISLIMRLVLLVGAMMLVANVVLGIVSLNQTKVSMRSLIDKNMLDIVNSAAGLLDGDFLAWMTEADMDGEDYRKAVASLSVFQKNADIRFIYVVRRLGDEDRFGFIVDPDPEAPAAFGEEIVITKGLLKAGDGAAAVDDLPMADRWGNFYSAYSPVFDSAGNVAGIVGIDFDADWYDAQVRSHTLSIGVISAITVLIGGIAVFLITHGVRRRFAELDRDLSGLSKSVDQLMDEVMSISGFDRGQDGEEAGPSSSDELEVLGRKIHDMQQNMVVYLDYMHKQAYVDALTRVGSSAAYHEATEAIERRIKNDGADFAVAVFDINNLKEINDIEGHPSGDFIICGAAECISKVFGVRRTYRIGGDEYAVLLEGAFDGEIEAALGRLNEAVEAFNAQEHPFDVKLAISAGWARYEPGTDESYKTVFARADRSMYEQKKQYYETVGNRRGKRQ